MPTLHSITVNMRIKGKSVLTSMEVHGTRPLDPANPADLPNIRQGIKQVNYTKTYPWDLEREQPNLLEKILRKDVLKPFENPRMEELRDLFSENGLAFADFAREVEKQRLIVDAENIEWRQLVFVRFDELQERRRRGMDTTNHLLLKPVNSLVQN